MYKEHRNFFFFQGSYLNIDMFKSQAQVLRNLVGDGRPAKRVGNQCWF